jgi:hypothetical protein
MQNRTVDDVISQLARHTRRRPVEAGAQASWLSRAVAPWLCLHAYQHHLIFAY